jgi:hypothetical protein
MGPTASEKITHELHILSRISAGQPVNNRRRLAKRRALRIYQIGKIDSRPQLIAEIHDVDVRPHAMHFSQLFDELYGSLSRG